MAINLSYMRRRMQLAAQPHKAKASGAVATFQTNLAAKLDSLFVDVTPVQDLHGQANPYPAGGSPQRWDEEWESGTYTTSGAKANDDTRIRTKNAITVQAETSYYFKSPATLGLRWYDSENNCITSANTTAKNETITSPANAVYLRFSVVGVTSYGNDISINYPSTDHDYHPYSNVCPITGWAAAKVTGTGKNLCGGEFMADSMVAAINNATYCKKGSDSDGDYVTLVGNNAISGINIFPTLKFKENTRYTFIIKAKKTNVTSSSANIYIRYTDGTYTNVRLKETGSVITNEVYTYATVSTSGKTVEKIESMYSSGVTNVYYGNCGIFEGALTTDDFAPYVGTTAVIQFGQTLYGARIDWVRGVARVTHAIEDMGNLAWAKTTATPPSFATDSITDRARGVCFICSCYKTASSTGQAAVQNMEIGGNLNSVTIYVRDSNYDGAIAFKTSVTGQKICYELAEPVEIPLNLVDFVTVPGINNVFADCGNVDLSYWTN